MYICTCEICHSKFQPTTGSRNVNRYCSLECSGVGQSRAARQRYEQSPKIGPTSSVANHVLPHSTTVEFGGMANQLVRASIVVIQTAQLHIDTAA